MKTNFLPLLQMDLYGAMGDDGASLPMKTAIQELIEFIDDKFIVSNSPQISSIYHKAQELLEKEKEQIINFAYEILEKSDEHQSGYVSVEEIYNKTYNQNK